MICLITILVFLNFGFFGAPFFLWAIGFLGLEFALGADPKIEMASAILFLIFIIVPVRRNLISRALMTILKQLKLVPAISLTEKEAIEAGNTWVEKEFFKGNPNLKSILSQPLPVLTEDEKKFLDGPVETLCKMINDWEVWQTRDIPANVWEFIRKERFLGLVIAKEYGGLGFSPFAHSEVIKKIASKSFVVAIYVMVPNSLGPAELIHRYGTDEQKKKYLPKLASGEEIPCFGLTEALAGSDAGNVQARGEVFKKGNEIFVRLNWDKRYISLAKISTLIGLAFHLKDPDKLLGDKTDLGITCALIPSKTPGITLEHRHDPLGVPFYNCPMHGKDVEIPLSALVGGKEGAGQGWKMLMECLAAGRGISFPAQMAGSSQLTSRIVLLYSQIREQFGVSIRQFEGVQKPLAEITAFTYLIEALRKYTLSALQQGGKPAIVASISKYYSTEYSRKLINHAMDVMGGAAISLGPKNKIAPYYMAAPISITVEGANILTRSLMIFGQGALRAHPYAFPMIDGLEKKDVILFDRSFFSLVGHGVQNFVRSVLLSLTRGYLAHPFSFKKQSRYYRKISWASATFAFFTDVAMGALGGSLKFKEAIGGRFADIVSNLYMTSAILRKYESEGEKPEDWEVARYALDYLFHDTELAFQGLYSNFPGPVGLLLKPVFLWSRLNPLSHSVADHRGESLLKAIYSEKSPLLRMTQGIYEPKENDDHLVQIEAAVKQFVEIQPLLKKMKKEKESLSQKDLTLIKAWRATQLALVQVDEFTEDQYHHRHTQ